MSLTGDKGRYEPCRHERSGEKPPYRASATAGDDPADGQDSGRRRAFRHGVLTYSALRHGALRHGAGRRWPWMAVIAAVVLVSGLCGTALASASSGRAPAAASGHYWTLVRLHGHSVKVHPHGRFGAVPLMRSSLAQRAAGLSPQAAGNLIYNGGPVAHAVAVYLDFWGSQWDSDSNGVEQYEQNFFSGLGQADDNWSPINSQYTDTSGQGPAFNGSVLAGVWADNGSPAPQSATQSDIAAEAVTAAQHFGVSGDDIEIVVLSPSGTSPDGFPNTGFCAWHDFTSSASGNIPYTNMPYVLDAGANCGANSVSGQLDGFSIVNGHEYAETVSDPEPSSGWIDSSGQENGDKCAWTNLSTLNLSTGSFAVQPIWSNQDGGCTLSAP